MAELNRRMEDKGLGKHLGEYRAGLLYRQFQRRYQFNIQYEESSPGPAGGNTKLAVATTAGLFLSENALDEQPLWEMLIKGDFYDVERDLLSDTIIYASGSDTTGVFKINLNNKTYGKLLDPDSLNPYGLDSMDFKRVRRLSIEISPAAPNYLFAIYTQRDFAYSRLLRYDINDGTWAFKGELPSDQGFGGQAFNGYERTLGWDIMPDTNNAGQLCLLSCIGTY